VGLQIRRAALEKRRELLAGTLEALLRDLCDLLTVFASAKLPAEELPRCSSLVPALC
jgi:hypothetical protein